MLKLEKWIHPDYYIGKEYPEYYIVYSHNRDSRILEESNYSQIEKELKDMPGFINPNFSHYLCGWVQVIMIHEKEESTLSRARDIINRLNDYPILNEDDYSTREYDHISGIVDDILRDIDNLKIDIDIGIKTIEEANKKLSNSWGDDKITIESTREELIDIGFYHGWGTS